MLEIGQQSPLGAAGVVLLPKGVSRPMVSILHAGLVVSAKRGV